MLFEPGFLGTKALFYMDMVTLYFAILPFLLAGSIYLARKRQFNLHYKSQLFIYALTIFMVLIFETGVRMTGGFSVYAPGSSLSYDFLVLFLSVHILIALMAVGGWTYQLISSLRSFREGRLADPSKHRRIGKWIFAALCVTSLMGCSIYVWLFT